MDMPVLLKEDAKIMHSFYSFILFVTQLFFGLGLGVSG